MPGQKISSLSPVSDLQAADQLVLARSGSTYKITGDKFASKAQLDSLSATSTGSFALKTDLTSLSSTVDNNFALKTSITSLSSTVDNNFILKPATASAQQVLTYNGSTTTWVASAAPDGSTGPTSAKAWVNWNASTNAINSSYNVSSITYNAVGNFTVNFPTGVLANANYSFALGHNEQGNMVNCAMFQGGLKTTTQFQIFMGDSAESGNVVNPTQMSCIIFGN